MDNRVLHKRLNDQTGNAHLHLVDIILHGKAAAEARFLDLHILLDLLQLAPDINKFIGQLQIVAHITGQVHD
ncbi:hypothetical protein D3C79_1022080 [compost metagenome]